MNDFENIYGLITSISTLRTNYAEDCVSGNLRLDPHIQLGISINNYINNPNDNRIEDYIIREIRNDGHQFASTLTIDKSVLDNNNLMRVIREKIGAQRIPVVRILDEGYQLTREDLNKLPFADHIAVDNCTEELRNDPRIIIQNGVFKYEYQSVAQPVLERRNAFDELVPRKSYHINHRLNEQEFEIIAQRINADNSAAIELDYFDPNYYAEFLNGLQRHHVRNNVNIQLIGYLLQDQINTYESLQQYPYEIDIVYSTCHDLIDMYTKEPLVQNRVYYSQVEGGGKTSLQNYLNVIRELTDFEQEVQRMNLSPLEIAVMAKMKLDEEFIYDPDADFTDEWDNINLSQLINHTDADGRRRGVCMGFSTLYSALLRRNNIPMFRYSTTGHSRNVGRIKDDKYGVDSISTADVTWDLQSTRENRWYLQRRNEENLPRYTHFMIAPREWPTLGVSEHMTVADTFCIPREEYENISIQTTLPYELFYDQAYNPMGYAMRILELMGVTSFEQVPPGTTWEEYQNMFYDNVYRLCENGYFEGIPQETITQAIVNVLRARGMNLDEIENYREAAHSSMEVLRPFVFDDIDDRGVIQDTFFYDSFEEYEVPLLTQANVRTYSAQNATEQVERDTTVTENQNTVQHDNNQPEEYVFVETNTVEPTNDTQNVQTQTNDANTAETNTNELQDMLDSGEGLIPGTNIPRPRDRGIYESDEEYVEFLRQYYERHFPRQAYVEAVLRYASENQITLFDYYTAIARMHHEHNEANLPEFERNNPFLSENEIRVVREAENEEMPLYFASSMSKVIEKNITQARKNQYQDIFVDIIDRYNEEIGRMR